jgi:hypothetical protein
MPENGAPAADNPPETPQAGDKPGQQELERLGGHLVPRNEIAGLELRRLKAEVEQAEAKAGQAGDDRSLRRSFAIWTATAVGIQIVVANIVFVVYGAANAWVLPSGAVSAWLGATIVQVVSVAVVIVRGLFGSSA